MGKTKWGDLAQSIEDQIITSIRKGMEAGEPSSIRPLREVFQNSDDEHSDRIYIRIDTDAVYFMNDW